MLQLRVPSVARTIGLASNHVDTWGWIVMAPVVMVMLYPMLGN